MFQEIEEVYNENELVDEVDQDLLQEFELFESSLDDYMDMEKAE